MNWFNETFQAADAAGVTSIKAERWGMSHSIAFWIEPKEAGQRFWEELEKFANRNAPWNRYFQPPIFYVFGAPGHSVPSKPGSVPTNTEWAAGPRKPFPDRAPRPSLIGRAFLGTLRLISRLRPAPRLSQDDMLLTIATMALRMEDLTGHDVIESLEALGYRDVVERARKEI